MWFAALMASLWNFNGAAGRTQYVQNQFAGMNAASGGPRNSGLRWAAALDWWITRFGASRWCQREFRPSRHRYHLPLDI